ncbi:hypothetical protein N7478_010954 [Penicillium angulare]|uniref:uncharacterized protein n=1 Tax=Penicillium angulare TaxID=116970 RepID=UPI00253FA93B|nr:uncharacterized protein N7478_010954 [Penicillium angulare]KAJ5263349.1 hypothetical protein N7478_010954 [Penicillium angulare]
MAYSQRPVQRPPPLRQYNNSPAPGGYATDAMYGQDPGYAPPDAGYADPGHDTPSSYGYQGGPPGPSGPPPPQSQPRSMRPPGPSGSGRPPPGYDGRRGYPGDRPPPQGRSRTPGGGRPPPRQGEGFDGPFPAVPPGRDPRDPRGPRDPRDPRDPRSRRGPPPGGLDRDMAAMDINGRPPRDGRRPDMRGPPPRGPPPGRGRGGYPPGPPRSGRPPMGPNGPMMGPPRSATMPLREPPPGAGYGDYPPMSPMGDVPPRPSTAGSSRPPRGRPYNDINPSLMVPPPEPSGLMAPPPDPTNRVSYAPKDFLDSYYEGTHEDEPDMPNFDAMPHSNGPLDEMGLDVKPKAQTPVSPASPGSGQYAPYTPGGGPSTPHSQSQPSLRDGTAPNQFENAGFNFDIAGGDHSPAASGYGHSPNGIDQAGGYFPNGASPYSPGSSGTPGPPGPPGPPAQQGFSYEQQQTPDAQQNADALPSHPTPFRPGHDAKPAPVRNYNNTPAPTQAPVAPLPPTPDGQGPITQDALARLQQKAQANPSDPAAQLALAKGLAEAATVLVAENNRLDPRTKAKVKEKYIMDALKIVKKLSSSGFADAQFYLADCYGEGLLGLEADPKEAFNLYHSAAKNGHAQSAYRVAVCCEIGQEEGGGTKRDPFKAVNWYKRAAALGDTPAMYKMGMISLKGLLGQARSPREGVSWLKRAAERADEENPHALHELALMYATASGNDSIVRDEAYASQLFHQAAELGYKFSQFRLGTAYEYGLMGCPADNRMSIIWYTRAAAQGEHQSELALSGWYLTGSDGVLQQSDTEAYLWARKAATAGLAKAEYAMGYFTEVGIGSAANMDDAKRWYWRAAAQGFPKARERLEELKKGGGRMQKTRLSRNNMNKQQGDGDCVLM